MEEIKQPRVLHVVGTLERGGIQTWLLHIMRRAHPQFDLNLLVHTDAPGEYDDEIRALGIPILRCPHPAKAPVAYGAELARVFDRHGPFDVVHCHYVWANGWVLQAARQAGVPVRVVHSHSDYDRRDSHGAFLHRHARRLGFRLMRWLVHHHATLGFAVSREAAKSMFGPCWEADPRWKLLHCGIDLAPFTVGRSERATVRAELGIAPDAFVVGHVGRFTRAKNHRFLIDLAIELVRRAPDSRLLLVGEGKLRRPIEARFGELGLLGPVVFAGARPDVPRLMRDAMDVLVLPSMWEGLPLVGIEAQAAGLTSVISDSITTELDLIPGLIRRVSLDQPPSEWVRTLFEARAARSPVDLLEAFRTVERSPFNIELGCKELERAYAI